MTNPTPITSLIPMLDHAARKRAEDAARARVAGDVPKKQAKPKLNYATAASKYPAWMKPLITSPIVVALVAMLVYSAIRMYDVGMKSAITSGLDTQSAIAMGLLTIIMAELGAVGLQLAEANDSFSRNQVYALRFGSWICVLIAISGNAEAMKGHILDSVFTVLDTFAPPVLALILSMALKGQMLQAVAERHAAKQDHDMLCKQLDEDYKAAIEAHASAFTNAHNDPMYRQYYANALREAIYAANKSIGARAALLRDDNCDWVALVMREIDADKWFNAPAPMTTPQPAPTIVVTPVTPAELPAPVAVEDVGLPARKPAPRKRKTVDLSAAPSLFDDVKE